MWDAVESGKTIGQKGSENGYIISDEEYRHSCRITLEKDGAAAPYSITCGIYGMMCHTTFAKDEAEGKEKYREMKEELQAFIDSDDNNESGEWCEQFVSRY